jgi:acyl-CoA thioester hydrolase
MPFHPAATVRHGRHHYPLRVYYEDTDAGGVVYHANYLRFAERARTEALRDLGVPHAELIEQHGLMFMVRRVKLDYLQPARLDDSLVLVTWPRAVRAASAELVQQVFRNTTETEFTGRPLAAMEIGLACVRLSDQRPARLPERWRAALAGLLAGREEAPIGAQ